MLHFIYGQNFVLKKNSKVLRHLKLIINFYLIGQEHCNLIGINWSPL